MEINDKIIIVTGASQGIGCALAKQLAAGGAKVVLMARSKDLLLELEEALPHSFAVVGDVCKSHDVQRLIDATIQKFGRVDALVNAAGRGMWQQVENINIEEYQQLLELNVCAYLRTMQAVIPIMRRQGGGTIVNVSSMLTRSFYPNLAGYASTKYAVNSLTLSARAELAKDHIVVSLIRPKLVDTGFGKHSVHPEPDALRDKNNPLAPPMDTPEFVAEKIVELMRSGEGEMDL